MKATTSIPTNARSRKPLMQKGRKDTFIKNNGAKRVNREEGKASEFAQQAATNPAILQAYQQASPALKRPAKQKNAGKPSEVNGLDSFSLPANLVAAFELHLGENFADVRLYADPLSTKIAKEHNAAALTAGEQIFFNTDVFIPGTLESLLLLAHELYHTLQPDDEPTQIEVQLKPLTELNDRTPYQQMALERAAKIAVGEQGKVNSNALNEDKTRVGWEFLVEYFRTTFGDDRVVKDKSELKPGKFLEDIIKYVRRGTAQKVRVNEKGEHITETKTDVDLLPSWCGIFAFWALHKSGIHPPPWEVGKPNFTAADTYRKGEYLPRPGDIVIKNGYNHHALVVRTVPAKITDTKELATLKVVTINGNTAGSNHTGGQIQVKTDGYDYWDYYVNPFFKGVELTSEKDFKLDERLKKNLGEPGASDGAATAKAGITPADTSVHQYETSLEPVGLNLPAAPKEEGKKEAEPTEEPVVDPKAIMAQDPEYKEIQGSLDHNAKKQKAHDPADQKASEALGSALSPGNERLSTAKANKVTALGGMPPPPPFKADELKKNILKAVDDMLKERADKTPEGDKPKIQDGDIAGVKEKNEKDIAGKKQESVGAIEKAQDQQPKEDSVPERTAADVITEDAGPDKKMPGTDKAVAKPLADERITLDKESGAIDDKMAENEVDEQQLEESNEEKFTGALGEKRGSQAQAANIKEDYRSIEDDKLAKDKKNAQFGINNKVEKIHDAREAEFGNVNTAKDATKTADELKRKEISDKIEKLYTDAEASVNKKLEALDKSVNEEFDAIMATANTNFKKNVNDALDDEFTSEWLSKTFASDDYNRRVKRVFNEQSQKYQVELFFDKFPQTRYALFFNNAEYL